MSVSQRLKLSLSMNCLNCSVSSRITAVITFLVTVSASLVPVHQRRHRPASRLKRSGIMGDGGLSDLGRPLH